MNSQNNNQRNLLKTINNNLYKKHCNDANKYNKTLISRIIFNQKYHFVSLFKEILIFDDPGEFFKRFYSLEESLYKIKTYCDFYEKNSKIFPNYIVLPESKFIFKNIKKKQKMLDNINEINNKNSINLNKEKSDKKNSDTIFSNTIINSILSEKSSATISNERSIKKLIKRIYDNENQFSYREKNETENSNVTQSQFIELNISKIDYSLSNNNNSKNHYKKFIKEFKCVTKNINSGLKNFKEKKIAKQNLSGFNNVYTLKKKFEKNNNTLNYNNYKKIQNKINYPNSNKQIEEKSKSKSKSKSKNKDYLTERNNKSKINPNNSIKKKDIKRKIQKNIINQNKKINNQTNKKNKKEAKSMPKLSSTLNKNSETNRIFFQNKNITTNNNNKMPLTNNNNNININNPTKSFLKFKNIKLQKPISNSNIKIQFHNVPLSNYISKHIPSSHISLNTNFKNTSTLSKSKSKSKSNSKSKSKSPNSTSNSLNKKFRTYNTMKNFNKNIKFISNNIRSLIHKDILFCSNEGLQTERIKYKNNSKDNKNNTNPIKAISINKKLNYNNNNNNVNSEHKKIVSVTSEHKTITNSEREKNSVHFKSNVNNNNFSKGNFIINKISDSNDNKKIISDSCSPPNKNINEKNNQNKNNYQNTSYFKYLRDSSVNKGGKTNNYLYYTSHNYTHHPVKKIQNFDNIENSKKTKISSNHKYLNK